jgi:hypothetical protein
MVAGANEQLHFGAQEFQFSLRHQARELQIKHFRDRGWIPTRFGVRGSSSILTSPARSKRLAPEQDFVENGKGCARILPPLRSLRFNSILNALPLPHPDPRPSVLIRISSALLFPQAPPSVPVGIYKAPSPCHTPFVEQTKESCAGHTIRRKRPRATQSTGPKCHPTHRADTVGVDRT